MPHTYLSSAIPTLPGHNTLSIGIGQAFDVRPTVSGGGDSHLVNGEPLGIHRPAYAFGVQTKIWRFIRLHERARYHCLLSGRDPRRFPKRPEH
jgi:hypothetical protein